MIFPALDYVEHVYFISDSVWISEVYFELASHGLSYIGKKFFSEVLKIQEEYRLEFIFVLQCMYDWKYWKITTFDI